MFTFQAIQYLNLYFIIISDKRSGSGSSWRQVQLSFHFPRGRVPLEGSFVQPDYFKISLTGID